MGCDTRIEEVTLINEKEFNEFLDFLNEYWNLFGPIPPCSEAKIIKIALL